MVYEIRIGDAHTGEVHQGHLSAGDGRRELLTALQQYYPQSRHDNLIVLIGPPWRPLENRGQVWQEDNHIVDCFIYDRSVIKSGITSEQKSCDSLNQVPVPASIEEADGFNLSKSSQFDSSSSKDTTSEDLTSSVQFGPLQRALTDFENSFRLRLAQGQAYAHRCKIRADSCVQIQERQRVRNRALSAAIQNLRDHANALASAHDSLVTRAERHSNAQKELLMRFEGDLEALSKISMHPALLKVCNTFESGSTLADCVNFNKARRWAETCARSLAAFEANIDRVNTVVNDIVTCVKSLYLQNKEDSSRDDIKVRALESCVAFCVFAACVSHGEELTLLESDAVLASRLVAESSDSSADPTSALEVCRQLQERWDARAVLVPTMATRDAEASQSAAQCINTFDSLSGVDTLRLIADLQSRIHRVRIHHLATQADALQDKARLFTQLQTVRKLPQAHEALCLEIGRRRAYLRASNSKVRACAEQLAQLRLQETERRANFHASHGACLPKTLLKALPDLAQMPLVFSPTFEPEPLESLPEIDFFSDGKLMELHELATLSTTTYLLSAPSDGDDENARVDQDGTLVLSATKRTELDTFIEKESVEHYQNTTTTTRPDAQIALPQFLIQLENALKPIIPNIELTSDADSFRADRILAIVSALSAATALTSIEGDSSHPRISFCSLNIGDIALFTPLRDSETYASSDSLKKKNRVDFLAFHRNCPNRFLARADVDLILRTHDPPPDFVLGRITCLRCFKVTIEYNPFGLSLGTEFFELSVDPL